jgi:hypothetical protein
MRNTYSLVTFILLCSTCLACPAGLTNVPMDLTMSAARTEFEQIAFSAVKDLLNKTGAHLLCELAAVCQLVNGSAGYSAAAVGSAGLDWRYLLASAACRNRSKQQTWGTCLWMSQQHLHGRLVRIQSGCRSSNREHL